MKRNHFQLILFLIMVLSASCYRQVSDPGSNPLLPGYFADPTVKKFGDTYYIYSTTDGIKLASGQPTVWISSDFLNWYNYELDIELPRGLTNCWAPDVLQGSDGKYYYYMGNCQYGCNIYGYVSDTPVGPWKALNDGNPVIPAGTSRDRLPALDAQFLIDDDGSLFSFFGTWCTSFGGMGWVEINPDNMVSIEKEGFIPIDQIPEAFEAAYPVKRNDTYILMYSAGDCRLSSYSAHYAYSDHPAGPYFYGENNPLLYSSEDGLIDGPGHHSLLLDGDNSVIVYHRHDNPHSTGGEFRQVCADSIVFLNDSTINSIRPGQIGVGALSRNTVNAKNLATGAVADASSSYHLISDATRYSVGPVNYIYEPGNAVDDNNGTMWKAGSNMLPQSLTLDLGRIRKLKRIMIQFEYPTFYYQYRIDVSSDSINWRLFSDKRDNRRSGSPVIDDNNMRARFIKITITGTENAGMFAAIWNVKAYRKKFPVPEFRNQEEKSGPGIIGKGELIMDMDMSSFNYGVLREPVPNPGSMGGDFIAVGGPVVMDHEGVKCIYFDGDSYLGLSKKAPESLAWNSSFTVSAWVNNPEVGHGECIMVWNSRENMLQSSYAALMYGKGNYGAMAHGDWAVDLRYKDLPPPGKWNHISVSFDGMKETIYVNGKKDSQVQLNLFVENDQILIGSSGPPRENFTGYIYNARLYDRTLTQEEIFQIMRDTDPVR